MGGIPPLSLSANLASAKTTKGSNLSELEVTNGSRKFLFKSFAKVLVQCFIFDVCPSVLWLLLKCLMNVVL